MNSKESMEVQKYKSFKTWTDKVIFIEKTKSIEVLKLAINEDKNNDSWKVREAAAENPNADLEILELAMKDDKDKDSWLVRKAAAENPKADLSILKIAIADYKDSNSWYVRLAAVEHSKANRPIILQGFKDTDSIVKKAAEEAMLKLRNKFKIRD